MKVVGHSSSAVLRHLGAAGATAAALLLLTVASLASAAADASRDGAVTKEWVEIVLDLEQLPTADRERSKDRLQAIDDAIATEIPLFRSFDPREVLAESLDQLAALGAELDEADGAILNFDTLGATIPVAAREQIAALPWVDQVRTPAAVTPAGQFDSEGLAMIGSDVINGAGITGAGIKVAIIDDSFNHLATTMSDPGDELKNIPTSAQYRVNAAGTSYTNPVHLNGTAHQRLEGEHGTACAEVVYEVAPGVQFILIGFTAQGAGFTATQVEWAIRRAADLGAKVILVPVYIFHTMSNPTNSFTDDIDYATSRGATVCVQPATRAAPRRGALHPLFRLHQKPHHRAVCDGGQRHLLPRLGPDQRVPTAERHPAAERGRDGRSLRDADLLQRDRRRQPEPLRGRAAQVLRPQ